MRIGNLVSNAKVEEHVKGEGNVGSEKQYQGKAESLRAKTKGELYDMAKRKEVSGRSGMSKEELVNALKQ